MAVNDDDRREVLGLAIGASEAEITICRAASRACPRESGGDPACCQWLAVAKQALDRIGDLYGVEKVITGLPPDRRRAERQKRSKPITEALDAWAAATLPRLSRKSELAKVRYMRSRWKALLRFLDDGRLAFDNNPAERALRGVAIGRKNYLFAGSDAGGRRAAALYSLIETAKLNGLDPQKYLADLLPRIADHPARQIADLLPWHWKRADQPRRRLTRRVHRALAPRSSPTTRLQ